MWSIYSGDPGVDRHHPIFISNTHSVFPNLWSHSLFPRFRGSTQLRGSSWPGCIISSHLLPTLLQLELLSLTNSVWMSRAVWWNVNGGLSLPSSSIVSPQRPPSGASLGSLNGRLQVLLRLCSTTICGQIDHMYIYSDT